MITLQLPATSANLGPAFDAAALALDLWLEVEAEAAGADQISATGRNAEQCEDVANSLVLATYKVACMEAGPPQPLRLNMRNAIPLGMGLGSSAAAVLAGLALARHFSQQTWSDDEMIARAAAIEGHADNAAACWLGGAAFVATENGSLRGAISIALPEEWSAAAIVPAAPIATPESRKAVHREVPLEDAVFNLQRTALLSAAFASGNGAMLREATRDRLHQPARSAFCPLLEKLQPLLHHPDALSLTLSGAGPAVLLLLEHSGEREFFERAAKELAGEPVEVLFARLSTRGGNAT